MKKLLSFILCTTLLFGVCGLFASAEDTNELVAAVYVDIVDEAGELYGSYDDDYVGVTDTDGDGILTVNDALFCAHDYYYGDGAEGYATEGLSITKLWGIENSNYRYYVNNELSTNLLNEVKKGDRIYAFSYKDDEEPSAKYCYFDNYQVDFSEKELTLTLNTVDYDKDGKPEIKPLEGAVITIDGKESEFTTDKDGKVTIKKGQFRRYATSLHEDYCIISAEFDTEALLPSVCRVNIPYIESVSAKVAIVDDKGEFTVAPDEFLDVTDWDDDGYVTINDALIAAHEEFFQDGADIGFATEGRDDEPYITKLWGIENDGKFGCYVNHEQPLSLLNEIVNDDYIYAFCYRDKDNLSDKYSFFDETSVLLDQDGEVTLTLQTQESDWDEDSVTKPLPDATITIDGKETEFKTDSEGKVTLTFDTETEGCYVISAKSDTLTITPPICFVYSSDGTLGMDDDSLDASLETEEAISADHSSRADKEDKLTSPETGNSFLIYAVALLLFSTVAILSFKKAKKE